MKKTLLSIVALTTIISNTVIANDNFYSIEEIQQDPYLIRSYDNPSIEYQVVAVQSNPYVIKIINNPSEELKEIAILKDYEVIDILDNPSDYLKDLAEEQEIKKQKQQEEGK